MNGMDKLVTFLRTRLDHLELAGRTMTAQLDREWTLADVDAKRQIIELHKLGGTYNLGTPDTPEADWLHYCATCGSGEPYEYPAEWPCKTLLLLALPFADHPDYREEWRP